MAHALGRKPHDALRVGQIAKHRMGAGGPLPPAISRSNSAWTPTLAQNDVLPTCTVAGLANSFRAWCLTRHVPFDPTVEDGALFDLYAAVAGCAPTPAAIGATDGLVMLDLLDHVRLHGFRFRADQPPAEMDFAAIDPTDLRAVRDSILVHGSAYGGFSLYASDVAEPTRWDGQPAPPSVGGHCAVPWGYSESGFEDLTWGQIVTDDLAWWSTRAEECYSIAWLFSVAE